MFVLSSVVPPIGKLIETETIERFIEDQPFSQSFNLAPPPFPPSPVSKLDLF
jgi:hypothetical protein